MDSLAERPPYVWVKPDTQGSFTRVPLQGVLDVADLAAATASCWRMSAACLELILAAQPSAEPPLPAAISAALLGDTLSVTGKLASVGVVPGCWLLARVSADALTRAEAAAVWEREARLAAQALADKKAMVAEAARASAEAAAV